LIRNFGSADLRGSGGVSMLAPLSGHCGDTGDETLELIIHAATAHGDLLKPSHQA